MDTKQFIETIRNNARTEWNAALRFALFSFLYKQRVSVKTISRIIGCSCVNVYNGIYKHRQQLVLKDKIATNAEEEVKNHKICVKPLLVEVNAYFVRQNGSALIIDDIIY